MHLAIYLNARSVCLASRHRSASADDCMDIYLVLFVCGDTYNPLRVASSISEQSSIIAVSYLGTAQHIRAFSWISDLLHAS